MGKFRASDYFKSPHETRAKAELGADYFYNNRNVYSKNFVSTSYTNRLANNSFSELVKDDSVAYIKLVDDDGSFYEFPKSNNRVEMFYYKTYKHSYKEITKIEETTLNNVYTLKMLGYTEFYEIYKKNEHNVEYKLCNLAIRRV